MGAIAERAVSADSGAPEGKPSLIDDWLDEGGQRHRLVLDTLSFQGLRLGLISARNFLHVNQVSYGIEPWMSSVLIVLRHVSTAFGFNDAIWAKYGDCLSEHAAVTDPQRRRPPRANPFLAGRSGAGSPCEKITLDQLATLGARSAVCAMAATRLANSITEPLLDDPVPVLDELQANLIPNARMVPAGIVAVDRAQECGFSYSFYG